VTDTPDHEPRQGPEEDAAEGKAERSTEEFFAQEAGLEGAQEPELEPEFREALRDAAQESAAAPSAAGDTVEFRPGEAPEDPGEAEEGAAGEGQEGAGEAEEAAGGAGDAEEAAGESAEGAGEAEQPEDDSVARERQVRTVAIGAEPQLLPPAPPAPTPMRGEPEPTPRRPRLWWRFLLGSFLVVASCASATTAAGLLRITDIVNDIQPIPGVAHRLAKVDGGAPQTFLILGSDRRAANAGDSRGLSDTTILLRIDPDQNVIAVLNIPRDLKVWIPGYGTDKFNAAYALGGPKLTLRTVQRLTAGMGLQINHLVNVDFLGFIRAINAIDCVYVDVDRRYYHSNVGLPASQQYDEIDVYPGYQKLCGEDALDYVRYRHTDTDLVRAARQQDFLRLARQRVPPSKLLTDQDHLIDIFTAYTSSDIQSLGAMVQVLKLMIDARHAPIKEVNFPARLGPSYVYSSRTAIKGAVDKFLGFEPSGGPRGVLERADGEAQRTGRGRPKSKPQVPQSDGLVDASQGSRDVASAALDRARFRVFYPTRLPAGTVHVSNIDVDNPRVYRIRDVDGKPHQAYKFVMQFAAGGLPEYFGLQGVQGWEDPPVLTDPSETREIRGREFDIYLSGDRVRTIAWHQGKNSYWISNSLLQTLTNDQMLGVARTVSSLPPALPPKRRKR
jgi:polyisoprenyl-teichoic acid--peptidoglycan teichoic acid transferase